MQKGTKYYCYRSTYSIPFDKWIYTMDEKHRRVFETMFNGFGIRKMLYSAYFEFFRFGDGKYTLSVQKYVDDSYSIKFEYNPNYGNVLERFTNE